MNNHILLGVDTGGTFTDFVVYRNHEIQIHKLLSTPHAPEQAILQGIKDLGLDSQLDRLSIIHGSTVATNAVLEGKGVRTAYITNLGLKDILTIGRQARKELYNLTPIPEPPPVAEHLCLEIDTRIDFQGNQLSSLTNNKLEHLAQSVYKLQPDSVAINLLYSYINPQDEKEIESYLTNFFLQRKTALFISRSSSVLPEYKEYERGISTWINSWVGPKVSDYIQNLITHTAPAKITIMQSSGGTIPADFAAKNAVRMLLSGPAGGLAGAKYLFDKTISKNDTKTDRKQHFLTFDMGGTSTDVALIEDQLILSNQGKIGNYPISIPMVDMHTIGAGGGSIAYIDSGGLLQVGPKSAGANPGPACYGLGGKVATVTDANLILGRITSDNFLGGKMHLDTSQAHIVINKLAQSLHLSLLETAQGIIDIANEHMTKALRVMSVQKGIDPSQLTLVPFGGAGALHVCALADNLNMKQAVVPIHSGVLSAFGMLVAPSSRNLSKTLLTTIQTSPKTNKIIEESIVEELITQLLQLDKQGRTELIDEGIPEKRIKSHYSFDCRYIGQSYTLNINISEKRLKNALIDEKLFLQCCVQDFHQQHKTHYSHQHKMGIEIVTLRVDVFSEKDELQLPMPNLNNTNKAEHEKSESYPIYQRKNLNIRQLILGPALIIEDVSTTYLAQSWSAQVDSYGNLHLSNTLESKSKSKVK